MFFCFFLFFSTLLGPQSVLREKHLELEWFVPGNGAAVLKGLREVFIMKYTYYGGP